MENDLELRHLENCELRAGGDGRTLSGIAVAYNALSETIYTGHRDFRERILPGAFAGTLERRRDVRCLYSHNGDNLLGRTSSGTLALEDGQRGLAFSLSVPNTQIGNDVLELVKRGDLRGMSFAFNKVTDRWTSAGEREVIAATLHEISVVGAPAYPQTSVQARAEAAGAESYGVYQYSKLFVYERDLNTLRMLNDEIDREQLEMRIRMARHRR